MTLIISPLIQPTWLLARFTFLAWLINFLRCFASIPADIDNGLFKFNRIAILILLGAFAAAFTFAWKLGKSVLFNMYKAIKAFITLIIHDIHQKFKIRRAKAVSLLTFEDELAEAAEEQLTSELALIEAGNWDFEAVMRLQDRAEARARRLERLEWLGRERETLERLHANVHAPRNIHVEEEAEWQSEMQDFRVHWETCCRWKEAERMQIEARESESS